MKQATASHFWIKQEFEKQLVHTIDCEGDSIFHIRCREVGQSHWLVRVKNEPSGDYNGVSRKPKRCGNMVISRVLSKKFLIKRSGRQMRYQHEFFNPALFAGLWIFLSMFETMNS